VRASQIKGGLTVRTSFAPVTAEGVGGPVDVDDQNGAVDVRAAAGSGACGRISLKASFAPIRLALDPRGGYAISARTSFGRVSTEIPLTVSASAGSDALSGKIGDGACEVLLTNSNGNIDIVKAAGR
jgi:hypothetical protein